MYYLFAVFQTNLLVYIYYTNFWSPPAFDEDFMRTTNKLAFAQVPFDLASEKIYYKYVWHLMFK